MVLLGDEFMAEGNTLLADMIKIHTQYGRSVLALQEVEPEEIRRYGCAKPERISDHLVQILDIVEKPEPAAAPSNLAVMGRYVFTPEIFDKLEQVRARRRRRDPAHRRHRPARSPTRPSTAPRSRAAATTPAPSRPTSRPSSSWPSSRPDLGPEFGRFLADICRRHDLARRVGRAVIPFAEARAHVAGPLRAARPAARCRSTTPSAACSPAPSIAPEAVPPLANSAMDGYAVRAADVAGAADDRPVALPVVGTWPPARRPTVEVGPARRCAS